MTSLALMIPVQVTEIPANFIHEKKAKIPGHTIKKRL